MLSFCCLVFVLFYDCFGISTFWRKWLNSSFYVLTLWWYTCFDDPLFRWKDSILFRSQYPGTMTEYYYSIMVLWHTGNGKWPWTETSTRLLYVMLIWLQDMVVLLIDRRVSMTKVLYYNLDWKLWHWMKWSCFICLFSSDGQRSFGTTWTQILSRSLWSSTFLNSPRSWSLKCKFFFWWVCTYVWNENVLCCIGKSCFQSWIKLSMK